MRAFSGTRAAALSRQAARHKAMIVNASALAGGTLITAVLGFVYWWLAARSFAPAAVGFAAAAISMMNLLGHVGEFGLGPLLIGRIPKDRDQVAAMISTALAVVLVACITVALGYIALDRALHVGLGSIIATPSTSAMFVVAVAVTGFTLVLDQAFVGLLRSEVQMWRNVVFSVCKLGLLFSLAWAYGTGANESGIFATWLVGQIFSLACLAAVLVSSKRLVWNAPKLSMMRPLMGEVMSHHFLNVVLQAPSLAMPFVVTVVLSPQTNAAFFAAWSLVNVVLLVPASISTVLYSTGAREPELLASRLRLSMGLSMLLGAGAGLGLLFFSPFVLGLFSPAYPAIAGDSLRMLGFGTLGVVVKYHYVALQRLGGTMTRAAVLLTLGGAVELVASAVGGRIGGLTGFTEGWLAAVLVEALVLAPSVMTAMRPQTDDEALTTASMEIA